MDSIDILRATRNNLLKVTSNLSLEEVNKIPDNYNNNLIWNLGHVVVTGQRLCYKNSGYESGLPEGMEEKYMKGSKPDSFVEEEEVKVIRELMFSTIDQLKQDLEGNKFLLYKYYKTSFGINLATIHDAVNFNNIHEGMHLGYCMALRKLL